MLRRQAGEGAKMMMSGSVKVPATVGVAAFGGWLLCAVRWPLTKTLVRSLRSGGGFLFFDNGVVTPLKYRARSRSEEMA